MHSWHAQLLNPASIAKYLNHSKIPKPFVGAVIPILLSHRTLHCVCRAIHHRDVSRVTLAGLLVPAMVSGA